MRCMFLLLVFILHTSMDFALISIHFPNVMIIIARTRMESMTLDYFVVVGVDLL